MFRIPRVCDIRTWVRDIRNTHINSATIATHDTILIRFPRTKKPRYLIIRENYFWSPKSTPGRLTFTNIYRSVTPGGHPSWEQIFDVTLSSVSRGDPCLVRHVTSGHSGHVSRVTRPQWEEIASGVKIPRGFREMRDERGELWQH